MKYSEIQVVGPGLCIEIIIEIILLAFRLLVYRKTLVLWYQCVFHGTVINVCAIRFASD